MLSPHYVVGLDLGGTNVKLAIFKRGFKDIISELQFSTKEFPTKKLLFKKIIGSIEVIIADLKLTHSDILGLGIGVPGPVDTKRGLVYYFPNIPGWKNVALKKMLETKLKFPIFLDNDVKLMALAELKFGVAKNVKNCLCLTLGTGVGGALILEGKLFRGSSFVAGEIGHIPISLNGPRCNCGGKGCLERFIGNRQILMKAKQSFGREITLEELSRLAIKGNKKAIAIWQDLSEKLAIALTGLINVFNPQLIVIGGGLSNAGSTLFTSLRLAIKRRAMKPHLKGLKILKSGLGINSGLIGASILVEDSIAKNEKNKN
ncbi:MAG: ROK family protein [Candidatus Omnitrophota bacterium]